MMYLTLSAIFSELHDVLRTTPSGTIKKLIFPDSRYYISLGISAENIFLAIEVKELQKKILKTVPKVKGLNIQPTHFHDERPEYMSLVLSPVDSSYNEAFLVFASDIIASIIDVEEERALVIISARLKHWQRFFEPRPMDVLSVEEQIGLLGELYFLEHLLQLLPHKTAMSSWKGPTGKSKDFSIQSSVDIEIKSVLNDAEIIKISSEEQLERDSGVLFLGVYFFEQGGNDNLNQTIKRIKKILEGEDEVYLEFQALLLAAGYTPAHADEYAKLSVGQRKEIFYSVCNGFPCITSNKLICGVFSVRYNISLKDCDTFVQENAWEKIRQICDKENKNA